jgi:predicted RNase H-like HicB family nuclease
MKRYTVRFERDEDSWWVATVRGVQGVHSQGRSIDEARRRVREALALAIGDESAERAELVDDVRLPAAVKHALAGLRRALAAEAAASAKARETATRVTLKLTKDLRLSRRDAAELTGYSFQRIQQLAHGS